MEYLLLSATTIGLKDIAIGSSWLGGKLIKEDNQASASIDRRGNGVQEFHFGSWKSGNKTSVDFGRNADERIGMNPSITIGSPQPQITRTRPSNCNILPLFIRGSLWHGKTKIESKKLVENKRGKKLKKC